MTRSVANPNVLAHIRFRAESILTEIFRALNLAVNGAISALARYIFNDLNDPDDSNSPIPALFRADWFKPAGDEPAPLEDALDTFSQYMKHVAKWVAKEIHANQVLFYLLSYLTQAYFEALLIELNEAMKLDLPASKALAFTLESKCFSAKKKNIHAA